MILRGFFAIELHSGFDELEEYLKITEEYLQKAEKDFDIHVEEQVKKLSSADLPSEELDEMNEFYGEKHWDYAETFPRILRSSFFVSAYSLLEHKMATICGWLKKDKQIAISWGDLKGDTLDQFKSYCKLAHLGLSYNSQTWQEIQHYSRLRNCIVHNRGLFKGAKQEKELRAYAESKNIIDDTLIGLSIRPQAQIALTEGFCKEVTKTVWVFLKKVLDAYELQKQNQKADD
ncbi:hypothetical protein ACFLVG_03705 [Chloroflexota bacterium]